MSFQRHEESVEHAVAMPAVPDPDTLPTTEQELEALLSGGELTAPQRDLVGRAMAMVQPLPLDVRFVGGMANPFDEEPRDSRQLVWIRAQVPDPSADSGSPELEGYMHRCIAAFASDWTLCNASLRPHGLSLMSKRLRMLTSIDHSMWYHRPFDATSWMLYETDSPVATGARSLNQGRLFDRQGQLCVSVTQEALLRADPLPVPP